MTLYIAIVDDVPEADHYVVQSFSGDSVVKSYTIFVDKENKYEKSVCVL